MPVSSSGSRRRRGCEPAGARSAAAQDYQPGDRVTVIHWDVKFEASGKSVGGTELGDNYTVDRVDGNWLWVKSEHGYLRVSDVRPYDDAMAYFTDRVRTDADLTAYHNRGVAWRKRGEYDIAIGDFNEAIRLDAQNALAFNSRGICWKNKGDLDKALADYNEAIRLDSHESFFCAIAAIPGR